MTACAGSGGRQAVIQAEAYAKVEKPVIPPLSAEAAAPCAPQDSILKGPDPRDDLRAMVGAYGTCSGKHRNVVGAYNRVRKNFGR